MSSKAPSTSSLSDFLRFDAGRPELLALFAPAADWRKRRQYPELKPLDSFTRDDYLRLAWELLRRMPRYRRQYRKLEELGIKTATFFKPVSSSFYSSDNPPGFPGWAKVPLRGHKCEPPTAFQDDTFGTYIEAQAAAGQPWFVMNRRKWLMDLWGLHHLPDPATAFQLLPKRELFNAPAAPVSVVSNAAPADRPQLVNTYLRQNEMLVRFRLDASFDRHGGALPATPAMVAEYLAKFAPTMKVATLERRCVAIAQAHRSQGLKSPINADLVMATMKGIRRQHGTRQRAVKPITRDVLLEMLAVLDQQKSHPTKAARDRALLLVGFAGAFRRAELVALRVEDVTFHEAHAEVLLRFSKTDQFGKGRTVFLPKASGERCPIQSLRAWLEVARIETGGLFRSVTKGGTISTEPLSAQSVALIVKRAAKAMGREPEEFSGHSLRAGYVTTAAMASLPTWLIREQTGHRSDAVLAGISGRSRRGRFRRCCDWA